MSNKIESPNTVRLSISVRGQEYVYKVNCSEETAEAIFEYLTQCVRFNNSGNANWVDVVEHEVQGNDELYSFFLRRSEIVSFLTTLEGRSLNG